MHFSKSLQGSKSALQYHAPCFNRIDFVVIPSYVELPWSNKDNVVLMRKGKRNYNRNFDFKDIL